MSRPEPTGEAMRRTRAGGYPIKARRRNTATPKRRNAPKAKRSRSSPTALKETKVARLTRELQEALAQQTATSDVLRAISSTRGELEPVFNAMLEKATRICEATFGNLFLREGHSFRAVAVHTNKQGYDLRRNPVIDLRENPGVRSNGSLTPKRLSTYPIFEPISPISGKTTA